MQSPPAASTPLIQGLARSNSITITITTNSPLSLILLPLLLTPGQRAASF